METVGPNNREWNDKLTEGVDVIVHVPTVIMGGVPHRFKGKITRMVKADPKGETDVEKFWGPHRGTGFNDALIEVSKGRTIYTFRPNEVDKIEVVSTMNYLHKAQLLLATYKTRPWHIREAIKLLSDLRLDDNSDFYVPNILNLLAKVNDSKCITASGYISEYLKVKNAEMKEAQSKVEWKMDIIPYEKSNSVDVRFSVDLTELLVSRGVDVKDTIQMGEVTPVVQETMNGIRDMVKSKVPDNEVTVNMAMPDVWVIVSDIKSFSDVNSIAEDVKRVLGEFPQMVIRKLKKTQKH